MRTRDAFHLVLEFFDKDYEKTLIWFDVPNPALGNVRPLDMIKNGREEKLCKFIQNQLDGNMP